jgi:hypothetical protein
MFPTYVLTPEIEDHCYRWANQFDLTKTRHPGNEYERAMGRFGECCVSTYMRTNKMFVHEGPQYRQDLNWTTHLGTLGVEVKTKVQKYKPQMHYHITVDSENYDKQHNDAHVYVFGWVYESKGDTFCSLVGFELSTLVGRWQWFDKGDKYPESEWICRYPTYRNSIDGLKPVDVLNQYGYERI